MGSRPYLSSLRRGKEDKCTREALGKQRQQTSDTCNARDGVPIPQSKVLYLEAEHTRSGPAMGLPRLLQVDIGWHGSGRSPTEGLPAYASSANTPMKKLKPP